MSGKESDWGWPDAVAAAGSGVLTIPWAWRYDQQRRAAIRAVRMGKLVRVSGKAGADRFRAPSKESAE